MSIIIKKAGILDILQDLGRKGFRKLGINPNGAMDKTALRLINVLLENSENQAALEMHFPASEIEFDEDTLFALGGADFRPKLNNNSIENWKVYKAEKGSALKFTEKVLGNRCYISVRHGFKIEKWLESSSTNLTAEIGGLEGRKLKSGDKINFNKSFSNSDSPLSALKIARTLIPFYSKFPTVRIIAGADYQDLTALSEQDFLSQDFSISANSDRMGFRLEGKPLHLLYGKELVSSAVDFGTLQLLPDGQIIILMADHQTTGGYPHIAHVIEQDLPLVAQLGAGDGIGFHIISLDETENLKVEFEKDLNFLKMGVRFKCEY